MIINLRTFRGMNVEAIKAGLPITVTSDGVPVFKVSQIDNQATTPAPIDNQSAKQAKLAELRALIAKPKPLMQSHDDIPMYNPSIHKAGDRVRVLRGSKLVAMTIPELDADGQPMRW